MSICKFSYRLSANASEELQSSDEPEILCCRAVTENCVATVDQRVKADLVEDDFEELVLILSLSHALVGAVTEF